MVLACINILQFGGIIVDNINKKLMGTIKTFLLGVGTAYAIYFITRKRIDGTSILDDLLDNPSLFMNNAFAGVFMHIRK